jgi:hypothetical protein
MSPASPSPSERPGTSRSPLERGVAWAGFVEGEEAPRLHLTPMVRSYLEGAARRRR